MPQLLDPWQLQTLENTNNLFGMKFKKKSSKGGCIHHSMANQSVATRFPLPQANKLRLIDDFSINGVNATYGLREKLRVQSIDELCSYIAFMMDATLKPSELKLTGRTFDLKHAYRQLGVDSYHHELLKIAVKKPGGTYELFKVGALPFGAVGSVTAFLRVSNCLAFIASQALQLVLTAFFDDFTVVCSEGEEESATSLLSVWKRFSECLASGLRIQEVKPHLLHHDSRLWACSFLLRICRKASSPWNIRNPE
jgi:hypothetical protein